MHDFSLLRYSPLIASIEVLGKLPGGWLSGILADTIGYVSLFALGTFLSASFTQLVLPLRRQWSSR